jgi:aryl sulfotransferase
MTLDPDWPVKSREIVTPPCVSARWNDFSFRDNDIVIATWAKSGTTWTQQIVAQLIFNGRPDAFGMAISPWIDAGFIPNAGEMAAAQTHRRFLKTHLPVDALVYSPKAKYLYVGRDARDVFWSWFHHWSDLTPPAYEALNNFCSPAMQPPEMDIRAAYHDWLDRDAYPQSSFWDNVRSWWEHRHLPNLLLLHFGAMKADTEGTIRRIAAFLDIPVDDDLVAKVARHCSVEHMKELADGVDFLDMLFDGGGRSFINKGTNGRWRDVLDAEEVAKCDRIATERLSPECAHWLRTGEMPVLA